jgi:hypothetical protein
MTIGESYNLSTICQTPPVFLHDFMTNGVFLSLFACLSSRSLYFHNYDLLLFQKIVFLMLCQKIIL